MRCKWNLTVSEYEFQAVTSLSTYAVIDKRATNGFDVRVTFIKVTRNPLEDAAACDPELFPCYSCTYPYDHAKLPSSEDFAQWGRRLQSPDPHERTVGYIMQGRKPNNQKIPMSNKTVLPALNLVDGGGKLVVGIGAERGEWMASLSHYAFDWLCSG